jgi:hypothetical protein
MPTEFEAEAALLRSTPRRRPVGIDHLSLRDDRDVLGNGQPFWAQ